MKDKLTESELDGMLFVYYINKLVEFGLIEGEMPTLTPKGFDLAHELYEDERKLSMERITQYTDVCFDGAEEDFRNAIIHFVEHLQKVGFDKMKEEVNKTTDNDR